MSKRTKHADETPAVTAVDCGPLDPANAEALFNRLRSSDPCGDASSATGVLAGDEPPPPTAEQLLISAVNQLTIDCEADHCAHKRRALEQAQAALKSFHQSEIERE